MKCNNCILLLTFLCSFVDAKSSLICTNGFTLINNKCLKLFNFPSNHTEAERDCNSYDATLVTVKNAKDSQAISTIAKSSSLLIWLGLYCFDNDPVNCLWDDGSGPVQWFNQFSDGFPLVQLGNCVYYSTRGVLAEKWLSSDCSDNNLAYICELPPTRKDNCTYNYNGFCYTFSKYNKLIIEAQNSCRQECGNLVSIHSENENRYINRRAPENDYFIGALWKFDNTLKWMDGSDIQYINTDRLNPRRVDYCTAMTTEIGGERSTGSWYSADCSISKPYICKREAGVECSGPTVMPTSETPSNCNTRFQMAPGVISSPNLSAGSVNCTYQLATLGSYKIALTFTYFNTATDYVTVYDGPSIESPILGSYSGNMDGFTKTSSGNTIVVTYYKSYGWDKESGFNARFSSIVY